MPQFDAKNLPLGDPNIAASNYGVTTDNAASEFGRLWKDRATVDGGSKGIYDKMMQWSSPEALTGRGQDPNGLQWQLMRHALDTGQVDPRLHPDLLRTGLGLGLSENARAQQHKPTGGFLDTLLTDILPEIALGLVPGIGPGLAVAYGGIKGGVEDGVMGGLTGALSGYGAGGLGAGLGSAGSAAGGWDAFLDDPAAWAGNVGQQGVNAVTNTASNVGEFLQHPITGIENAAGDLWGSIKGGANDVAGFFGGGTGGAGGAVPPIPTGATPGAIPGATAIPGGAAALSPAAAPLTATGAGGVPGMGVGASAGGDLGSLTGAPGAAGDASSLYNPASSLATGVSAGTTDLPTIAPSAGAGAKSLGATALSGLGKLGITGANAPFLGLQAYNAIKGPQTSTAEKTLKNQAAPYNAEAKQLMDFYNSGQLHPSDEQAITQWQQQENARINDYWSRAGAPESSGRIQMVQDLEKKAQAMRDQTRQGYLMSALQAGGLGTQATSTLAQIQAMGDAESSKALEDLLRNVAQTNAYGQYNPGGTPAVPHA